MDSCATTNVITESLVKKLDIPMVEFPTKINAISDTEVTSSGIVTIEIKSRVSKFTKILTCSVVESICEQIPTEFFPRDRVKIPQNITLADPDFHVPRSVDLLIAAGSTVSMLMVGQIKLLEETYAQKTRLGWTIVGNFDSQVAGNRCFLSTLERQLSRFWETEEIGAEFESSSEETRAELHFRETVTRDNSGRYTVRLPFRESNVKIGESKGTALKRLSATERRLSKDSTLKGEYERVLEEYLQLDHMSLTDDRDQNEYFMPHHAVVKETSDTTKIRVVFDASARSSSGVSLNDTLLVGPTIQDKLYTHLIRFRTYNVVLSADIEKMYRQIKVHEGDRQFQKILWRRNDKIQTFKLNTLTFGVSASPFLAIRTIHQLADDERDSFPRAAAILKNHLYVDDLLTGTTDIIEAQEIMNEIIALLKRGGFHIRQWTSNRKEIFEGLTNFTNQETHFIKSNESVKTLGIKWNVRTDDLRYNVQTRRVENHFVTKRIILSEISKIFDPLGLVGPVIFYAKKMMQDVWRANLNWDESVPQEIYTRWIEFTNQLDMLRDISFQRKLIQERTNGIEIHGFCDASSYGFGACVYVRSRGEDGNVKIQLICAKSRVAPLKEITIPRMELNGALLLSRLLGEIKNALGFHVESTTFWCDSSIVLHWIKTSPILLKLYVATRIKEIQRLTPDVKWRYVRSKYNSADAISRGQLPKEFIKNASWFNGPDWLSKDKDEWPVEGEGNVEILELKRNICLIANNTQEPKLFERFSSYSKLIRTIARGLRWSPKNNFRGMLHTEELNEAESRIIRLVQELRFANEIKIMKEEPFNLKGSLLTLSPFIDDVGIIRVGGRLQNSELSYAKKHPILLPKRHVVTDMLIRETHERNHHTSIQITLAILRQRFWILDGRNQVRRIVRKCVRCFKCSAIAAKYKMGNLPSARVVPAIPFENTGVDFCGPFFIKERKFRNRAKLKVYICVFICLSIKAVHLEVVDDMTTEGFLGAFRRFIARRAKPSHVYSDNGSNFIGANNQLKELYIVTSRARFQIITTS